MVRPLLPALVSLGSAFGLLRVAADHVHGVARCARRRLQPVAVCHRRPFSWVRTPWQSSRRPAGHGHLVADPLVGHGLDIVVLGAATPLVLHAPASMIQFPVTLPWASGSSFDNEIAEDAPHTQHTARQQKHKT
jgi:hypothetical protein